MGAPAGVALWRHVARGADECGAEGDGRIELRGDPEVGDLHLRVGTCGPSGAKRDVVGAPGRGPAG